MTKPDTAGSSDLEPGGLASDVKRSLRRLLSRSWFGAASSVGALVLSAVVGSVLLLIYGYSPVEVYGGILTGAFGSRNAIAETLLKATPLIFTGLAMAVASRAGLFNIGGEGQLVVGALGAAMMGTVDLGLPGVLHGAAALAVGCLAGAAWGALAGWIRAQFGAHEVIVTIMLNYIALLLTSYMVNYPWKAEGMVAQSTRVLSTAELPRIMNGSQLSYGILIGILAIAVVSFVIRRTILGFEMRAVGFNASAAETGGVRTPLVMIAAMALAGAMAGLGGGVEVLGVHRRFIQGFSPGFGYDGIAVSVLANDQPWLIPVTAVLFGALRAGGAYLDRTTGLPGDFTLLIQGLVIFFAASPRIFAALTDRRDRR
ncbi:MAG: ABC transporter permease [Anaerolineae bacterium]|jgi:simple sugar transport system permease protein|nr:ABC transporter permease [Anaerolineae bacterium]